MSYQPIPPVGQDDMAGSLPVVIASDQSAVPVSAASLPLPSGAATSAKQDTGNTSVGSIDTKTPALGQALAAASVPVVLPAAQITTLTPPTPQTDALTDTQLRATPVPVSGTVTANLAAGTNNIGDVDVLTVPADPFGANADAAATAGSTGSIQAKLRLLTSQLDAVKTAVETLDNAIAGSEMQVDVVGALPAGTNAIGKLAANSGVDIGDVDVTSVTPGTAAGNLGKAEDAAHASGDTGVFMLGVRNDNATTTYGADQDYSPIATDLKGRVSVRQIASTATLSNVSSSASSVTVLAANSARVGGTIYNDSTQVVYLKFGATASTSSFTVKLAADTYYEIPGGYTGIIDGIWASANGSARVTELT